MSDVITVGRYVQQKPFGNLNAQQFYNNRPPNTLGPKRFKSFFKRLQARPKGLKDFLNIPGNV